MSSMKTWRNAASGVVILVMFALASTPAAAVCPNCPLSPLITAQKTAFTAAMALMNQAITMAIAAMGGGIGAGRNGDALAKVDAGISSSERKTFNKMFVMNNEVRANNTNNMQSTNCRLQTINNTATAVQEKFQQSVAFNLEDGVISLFFNRGFNPERTRVATMQRNCKNGQFKRDDMGVSWWTQINAASAPTSQCFEDATDADADGVPDFLHAFLKSTTILDHRVLVLPSNADMTVLNNPDGGGNPQTVWNGLTVKQKRYVSAVRFCENQALYVLQPLGISGDAAMDTKNQEIILQNLGAIARLDALVYACRSELARRTAPDATAMVAAGYTDMQKVKDNADKVAELLIRTGAAKRGSGEADEFQEIVGGTTRSYMSPAMLSYARAEGYCNNNDTMKTIYSDTGTDAQKTDNILRCEQLKQDYRETETIYRSLFNDMVAGVSGLADEFAPKLPTATRAEGNGLVQQASLKSAGPRVSLLEQIRQHDAQQASRQE